MLTGNQVKHIHDVILESYSRESLNQALRFQMNVALEDVVANSPLSTQVSDLVLWAYQQHCVAELVAALYAERKDNCSLYALVEEVASWGPLEEPARSSTLIDHERWSWALLRKTCAHISELRMAGWADWNLDGRSHYIRRDDVFAAALQFLASDKRCFVLVGESGVGKSSFLFDLYETLEQSDDKVCLLMYDAGTNFRSHPDVDKVIGSDLNEDNPQLKQRSERIWTDIAAIDEIRNNKNKLVLVVDTLNINQHAKALITQLDENLVQSTWKWLKLIVVSTPETWDLMRTDVSLAEDRYFRTGQAGHPHKSYVPFLYSVQLEPFPLQELPSVFSRYWQEPGLEAQIGELNPEVCEILRNPQCLRLFSNLMKANPGKAPGSLSPYDLEQLFINSLTDSKRVQSIDIKFLRKRLVPLLFANGTYKNQLTFDEIDEAGGDLLAPFPSEELFRGDYAIRPMMGRLADAGILTIAENDSVTVVRFGQERFYDYFVGECVYDILHLNSSDWRRGYLDLLQRQLNDHLFLWGAIKYALIKELLAPPQTRTNETTDGIFEYLANQDFPLRHELLTSLLTAVSKTDRTLAERIADATYASDNPEARKTALMVAGSLAITSVLMRSHQDPDLGVRLVAVRVTYHLWQTRPNDAAAVLATWAKDVRTRFGVPKMGTLGVCTALSVLMMTDLEPDSTQAQQTRDGLRSVWSGIIAALLFINADAPEDLLRRTIRRFAIRQIVNVAVAVFTGKYLASIAGRKPVGETLVEFFPMPADRKPAFERLLRCFDWEFPQILAEEDLLVEILLWNDTVSAYAIVALLLLKLPPGPDHGLDFVDRLFKRTLIAQRPIHCSGFLVTSVYAIVNRSPEPISESAFSIYREMVSTYFDTTFGLYFTRSGDIDRHFGIELFSAVEWQLYKTTSPALLVYALQRAFEVDSKHRRFIIRGLIRDTMHMSNLVGHPDLALEAVKTIYAYNEVWDNDAEIRDDFFNCIAAIRTVSPGLVEHFFDANHVPVEIRTLVRAKESTEDSWAVMLFPRVTIFLSGSLNERAMTASVVRMFRDLPHCRNLAAWMEFVLRETINLIYGRPII